MPFTIPNDAVASFADEAQPDAGDFAILGGISGVQSGGAVTANGTNMTLTVASSFIGVNGVPLVNAGGSAVIGAASANQRWDLVYISAANAITVLAGTPTATNPQLPILDPAVGCVLCAVYIPTSTSALQSTNLIDKRKQVAGTFERISGNPTDVFLRSRDDGDSTDRYKVTIDGKAVWTSGAAGTPNPTLGFDATLAGLLLTGKLGATASLATETPFTVTAAGSQSVDIVKIRSSAPADLVRIDSTGILTAPNIKRGAGAPNSAVTGNVGDLYQQTDGANGATLWIKETGNATNTGWNASGTTSAGLILGGGQCPTGTIVEFSCSVLPSGWLWGDGAAVSRATFSALNAIYAADGYPWGAGNGSTTFNLPDKRGLVTAGASNFGVNGSVGGNGRYVASNGTIGGEQLHQLSGGEVGNHVHTASDSGHVHSANKRDNLGTTPYTPSAPNPPFEVEYINSAAGFGGTGIGFAAITVSTNVGGNGSHNNIQPTVSSRFIVKF